MSKSTPIVTCDVCQKELGKNGYTSERHAARLEFLRPMIHPNGMSDMKRPDWDICADCLNSITEWAERRRTVERKRFLRGTDTVMEPIP